MPGRVVFDELPEDLQARLAASNPELRDYRRGRLAEAEDELEKARSKLATVRQVVADRKQARQGLPLWLRLTGVAGAALVIYNAAGGR